MKTKILLFHSRCILCIVPSGPFDRSSESCVTPQIDTILIDGSNKIMTDVSNKI